MWEIVGGIAIGIAGMALLEVLNEEAGREKRRWESKRREVERDIEYHRSNIKNHINEAQWICDFHTLCNLHYSSVKIADEAYKLLQDSKKSLHSIGNTLVQAKKQINDLYNKRKMTSDKEEAMRITQEINGLKSLRSQLFPQKDQLKNERNLFYEKVKQLNSQTRNLKLAIRDKTGSRGREWYNRLEARK